MEDGSYLEIKGYITEQWGAKLNQFSKPLIVLYRNDMNKYINYCTKKYGKDYINLYE